MKSVGGQIQGAAQQWAKARELDLGDLNPAQQKQVIADVGGQLSGISRVQVRDELLSLWVSSNEGKGRGLQQMGGEASYQATAQQRSVDQSAMMAVRGGAAVRDPKVLLGFEIALAGQRDGRVSVADVDDILAPFKAEGGLSRDQAETITWAMDEFNVTDAARAHLKAELSALQVERAKPADGAQKLLLGDVTETFGRAADLWRAGDEAGAAALYTQLLDVAEPKVHLTAGVNLSALALRSGDLDRVVELAEQLAPGRRTPGLAARSVGDRVKIAEEDYAVGGPRELLSKLWTFASSAHRSLGNKPEAYAAAKTAFHFMRSPTTAIDLAVQEKLNDNLPKAIELMRTAVLGGAGVNAEIALAGYTMLDGDVDAGQEYFNTLKPDPEDPTGFYMNAAWFSALKDDKPAVLENVSRSLVMAMDAGHRSEIRQYFESEVDLAKYQNDPDFLTLLRAGESEQ